MNTAQNICQNTRSIALIATVMLFSIPAANATRENFNGNVMPSGWTYDTSNRPLKNDTYFPIQFASSHVTFKNVGSKTIVECKADNYNNADSSTKKGGGVKTQDLVFTRGVLKGSFRMVHPAGNTNTTEIQKAISRTQASFWCIGVLGSNSYNTEIDVWEAAGGNRNQANHIEWTSAGHTPNSPNGPTMQGYYTIVNQSDPAPWTAFAKLTSWGTWSVNNNFSDAAKKAVFNGPGVSVTHVGIHPAGSPMAIIVHNKPWRFKNPTIVKAGNGVSASLQCDWVDWN